MEARILSPQAGAARLAAAKAALAAGKNTAGSQRTAADAYARARDGDDVSFVEEMAAGSAVTFEFEEQAAVAADPAAAQNAPYLPTPGLVAKAAPAGSAAPAKATRGGYVPLGYDGADNVIWSNMRNCVVRIKAAEITLPVMETWAGLDWVMANYLDSATDDKKGSKLNVSRMRSELVATCQAAGKFEDGSIFGAGIWEIKRGDERIAVCNSGGSAFTADGETIPRISDAGVFAESRSLGMTPTLRSATEFEVSTLVEAIESWNWRVKSDTMLVLGWLAASPLAGVLDRRPALFITGPRGSGKSTLLDLVKRTLGSSALKADGSSSTAAGIRQHMRHDARPIILDEFGDNEADSMRDSERTKALVSAIRNAYSDETGDGAVKGTSDGTGASYSTKYMALLSGIVPPPMRPADRSRLAICSLAPLARGSEAPELLFDEDGLADLGARIRMRMFRLWPLFKASARATRRVLRSQGREARFADTIGTLLAAWYVLTTGEVLDLATATQVIANCDLSHHVAALEGASDERECADWMLGYTANGASMNVGEMVRNVMEGRGDYARTLEGLGLKLDGNTLQVCGSKAVQGIREVFEGSAFGGGSWKGVLERVLGARSVTPRFAGKQTRSVAVPLSWLLEEPEQGELEV